MPHDEWDKARDVNAPHIEFITATDLMQREFPEPRFVVPGIITEGVTLLAGKPKLGKSWMALGIGAAVAGSGKALGNIDCEAGDVLYLALEDNPRRLQQRLKAVLQGAPAPPRLTLTCSWPAMDQGGLDELQRWMDDRPETRLVLIDTFEKIRGQARRDGAVYRDDVAAIAPLKAFADEHEIGLVMVHHLRKGAADDVIDEVSGSTGLTGSVDSILVLKRERGEADAVLHITGRDVEEAEHALQFDGQTGQWIMLGDAAEHRMSRERQEIMVVMRDIGTPMRPAQVADALGDTSAKNKSRVKRLMHKMGADGTLKADYNGAYRIPPSPLR